MWLGCVFIVCVFFIVMGMIINDAYCTELKIKRTLNEEKQRLDASLEEQKQKLDTEVEMERIKAEYKFQFVEGQLKTYKTMYEDLVKRIGNSEIEKKN